MIPLPVQILKMLQLQMMLHNSRPNGGITAPTELPDTTHGGIRKPYKPPSRNVLGVHSVPGQPFTTSRNLEAARRRMEKNVGKKAS